jgi:DNA-binding MarR family transcriptional regulator
MTDFSSELIAICRIFGVFEREQVCCGTVTVPQCLVLQALLEEERDINGLAELSHVTASAMTRLVDGLEKNGWIERERGADDRRRIVVTLTASGRAEAERLRSLTDRSVEAVLSKIPKDKRAQVLESVHLVREALEGARDTLKNCCS